MTKGILIMWGVLAEMKRDIISQRVKSGMRNTAAKGKRIGRSTMTKDALPDKLREYYRLYEYGQITVTECARLMGCSRTTVYKYMEMVGIKK